MGKTFNAQRSIFNVQIEGQLRANAVRLWTFSVEG
jgi:hypothetical protein